MLEERCVGQPKIGNVLATLDNDLWKKNIWKAINQTQFVFFNLYEIQVKILRKTHERI